MAFVYRDENELEQGDSLREFMETIREQDFAILIVSDAYLQRRNCMFEVLELLKDYSNRKDEDEKAFWNKIALFVTATGLSTIVPGPKSIGVHGDSYIYAVFKALGVIKLPLLEKNNE